VAAVMYSLVCIAVPILHARESALPNNIPFSRALSQTSLVPLAVGILTLAPVSLAIFRFPIFTLHFFGL
jgi:hypothetical protein